MPSFGSGSDSQASLLIRLHLTSAYLVMNGFSQRVNSPFLPNLFVRVLVLRKFHFLLPSDRARINPVAFQAANATPAPYSQLASPAPASRHSGASAGPDIKRTIAPKSLERFKQRIRETTRRAKGVSIKTTMEELAKYMRGWRGYFGFCETPEVLIALTRWVRLRLRAALWRQWKTPRRRRAALIALGVSGELRNMAGSGRGPWHIARSKALSVGLSNAHFKSLGLLSLVEAR